MNNLVYFLSWSRRYFPDDSTVGPKMICPLCTFNFNRSLLGLSKMAEEISRASPGVPIIMFQTWGRLNGDKVCA